jgi:hypothetical protein
LRKRVAPGGWLARVSVLEAMEIDLSGLKPHIGAICFGTAEAVPLSKTKSRQQ